MKYQLIIKDNETGETLKSESTDCIIYAAHTETNTAVGVMCDCKKSALVDTYAGVQDVLADLDKENPELKILAALKPALEALIRDGKQKEEEK